MKKIILSAFIAMFSVVTVVAQSTTVELSSKVKVTFPVKAEKQAAPMETMKVFTTEETNNKSFMSLSMDMSAMGVTAELIEGMGPAFFEQMKAGMMGKLKGAKVIKEEVTKFKGKTALYMEIDGADSEEKGIKGKQSAMYIFFVDATMYQVGFYAKKVTKEDGADFFESVVITE